MNDGKLYPTEIDPPRGKRVTADLFFRALAETHGSSSLAIVLSGATADGAIGLKRIKECGGLTVAQDPLEAEHDGMPRAAIATGMVDWVLRVEEMPARLATFRANESRLRLPPEPPASFGGGPGPQDDNDFCARTPARRERSCKICSFR